MSKGFYTEKQVSAHCAVHGLNHVFQQELVVIDKTKVGGKLKQHVNGKWNIQFYCEKTKKMFDQIFSDDDDEDPPEPQCTSSGNYAEATIVNLLKEMNFDVKTIWVDFSDGRLPDKKVKAELQRKNCLGAVIGNANHYTAITRGVAENWKEGQEVNYMYIDSMHIPAMKKHNGASFKSMRTTQALLRKIKELTAPEQTAIILIYDLYGAVACKTSKHLHEMYAAKSAKSAKSKSTKSTKSTKPKSTKSKSTSKLIDSLLIDENVVKDALTGSKKEVIANCYGMELTRAQMQCLEPGRWLNSEVISYYANTLQDICSLKAYNKVPKCHIMSSFFYDKLRQGGYNYKGVKNWTKDSIMKDLHGVPANVSDFDKVIIPINHFNVHWALAVFDMNKHCVTYYDSLHDTTPSFKEYSNLVIKRLSWWMHDEQQRVGGVLRKWKHEISRCPKQSNGHDCGVFVCLFLFHIIQNKKLHFSTNNCDKFRSLIVHEIMQKKC